LRKYKLSWERQVFESRNIHRPSTRYRRELITQVDLIICEILAVKPTSDRAKELLNILFELHLWRGTNEIDSKIVDGLNHLALMSGLGSPHLAGLVAEKLWEMSFHYVGPSDVPMRPEGLALVLKCIDAMSTLLRFNSEFGHGRKATDKILEHSEDLYQIGLWYKKPSITKKIAASYAKGLEASAQEGQSSFPYGKTRIRRSIRNLLRMTAEDKGEWQAQSRALRRLLDEHG
jgi:hypothetical protein